MTKHLILIIASFLVSIKGQAQPIGCFNTSDSTGIELTTDLNFDKYNALFVGEFHGVYSTPEVKLAMIKYLNNHHGITDVFLEVGYSAAYLFNSYLETGDDAFISNPSLLYTAKKPDIDFWHNLYEYNSHLEHKIIIRAMDFERLDFIKVLKLLMPMANDRPAEIAPVLRLIDTMNITNIGALHSHEQAFSDSIYNLLKANINNHIQLYKDYFGADFNLVEGILNNESTYANYAQRNQTMYNNIAKQVDRYHIKKLAVFAGIAHANKADEGTLYSLIAINKIFIHKTVDITMACKNCYDWQQPDKGVVLFKAPYNYYKDTVLMNTIFSTWYSNKCKYTLLPASKIADNKVRRYSDFLILMKDQPEY